MPELLAPAGNLEKLKAAVYYGADAVYLAGKQLGLRAFADNFTFDEMRQAIAYAHSAGKKVYVTCNVFVHAADFALVDEYAAMLRELNADGVIISDFGIFARFRKVAPELALHVSTQANVTNAAAAAAWVEWGAKRIVLARELTLDEIKEIAQTVGDRVELETFVHGAMCISYSGRCLLSDYLTGRHSNEGACAQCCRWEYSLLENSRGEAFPIEEDGRGTYILNSRDMNMLAHLDELLKAGVTGLKIEGRVKSTYYVACIVNAYRRALDAIAAGKAIPPEVLLEPEKTSHRSFGTGFYFGAPGEYYPSSKPQTDYDFCGIVADVFDGGAIVEMRNRFRVGDSLEVLAPHDGFLRSVPVTRMQDEAGAPIDEVTRVQQKVKLYTDIRLAPMDILRRKRAQ